ncbi:MAG: glycosyltransferase family 4 protein [Bacteroidaceae bacterium]|nr:glycosyltransferase family 4 protein [Bacteroidaceae bacterium]
MNILFISHEASRSGAPLALLYLLKEIKSKATDITFTVLQLEGGPLTDEFRKLCKVIIPTERPWRVEHLFKRDSLRERLSVRLLINHLKKQHFDLIYANTVVTLPTAVALKTSLSIPVVLHAHEASNSFAHLGVTKDLVKQCDYYIGASGIVYDSLIKYGSVPDRTHTIYPFSEFADRIVSGEATPPKKDAGDKVLIGCIGPMTERKGADFIPMIVRRLHDLYPECPYEIQCIGTYMEGISKKVEYDLARIGMSDKVRNLGSQPDPLPLYLNLDFLLVLSREDPFPLAVVENGLLGKPSILFDGSCGTQRFINNGVNGVIVPYMDIDGMAKAIYHLCQDREARVSMGQKFQKTLSDHYQHARTNDEIIKLLYQIGKDIHH